MQAQSPQLSIPKPAREFKIAASAPPLAWHHRHRKGLLLAAALVLLVLVGLVLTPPRVDIGAARLDSVKSGSLSLGINGYGKLIPSGLMVISSPSGGRVVRIESDIGSQLKLGDPVLTLANPELAQKLREAEKVLAEKEVDLATMQSEALSRQNDLQSALENGRDDLKVAKLELEAMKQLMDDQIIARIGYEKAAVKLGSLERQVRGYSARLAQAQSLNRSTEQARAMVLATLRDDVSRLRLELAALAVKAPKDGVLIELTEGLGVGSQVPPGGTVARLSSGTDVSAELAVPASRAEALSIGQPVQVEVNGKRLAGQIKRIDPQVVRDEIRITVGIPQSRESGLFAGQPVNGSIVTRQLDKVQYVERPNGADDFAEGFVFQSDGNGLLTRRRVKFGAGDSRYIVVESGLAEGARIVLDDMSQYADRSELRQAGEPAR